MRRRYGYPPESRGLLDTAAATRFSALVARSNPAVARVIALGALALVAVAAVVIVFVRGAAPPEPSEALDPFVAAWSRGDDRGAAALTSDPAAAGAALAANRRGLDGARVRASTQDVAKSGDTARATVRLSWNVPGIGAWSYRTRIALERRDGHWKVVWAPTVVHPRLTAGRRLGTVRDADARAPILDRQGQPLVTARQVVRIGLDRATVKDVDASAAALAGVLHVDGDALASAAKRAGPQQFVEAVTLRASDYPSTLAQQVEAIQGAQAVPSTQQLAPSKAFARALLGTVGPATAEQIQRSKGKVGVGDDVGQFGLEARYQDQLAGTPTRRIVIRSRTGAPVATLLSRPGRKGRELRTTLDRPVQAAAEAALGRHQAEVRARRRAALDGRRPRRRQPAHRRRVRPRDRRPLRPRLDVQGRHHRGAPARRRQDDRHRRLPEDHHRRGQGVQELRGRGRRCGALRPRLRAVVQHRLRLARQAPGARRAHAHRRATSASDARAPARCPPAATRSSARRR